MVDAVRAAVEDCDGAGPGGTAPAGRRLLSRIQSLRVANPLSWHYENPGLLVAEALGIEPAQLMVTTTGGNNPQSLVNATALAIGRGELDVAVLVGADCVYTRAATRRHADRPLLPWTVQPPTPSGPRCSGTTGAGTTDAEEERGLDLPIHVFPLFENALRAEAGRVPRRPPGPDRGAVVPVLGGGGVQPLRLAGQARTAEEITEVVRGQPDDRLPLHQAAHGQHAGGPRCGPHGVLGGRGPGRRDRRGPLGLPPGRGRRRRPLVPLPPRSTSTPRPAIRLAGSSALALAGTDVDEVAHLDLYSCFPSAVQIAAEELGLPDDDPARPLTVTGGLTFAGGPGNNYGTHAVASMVGGPAGRSRGRGAWSPGWAGT